MLHILWGPDTFSRDEALKELTKSLVGENQADTTALDGSSLTVAQLKQAANTIPFLAPRRLVVIDGLLARFEERRPLRASEGKFIQDLQAYLPVMPPTTDVVLLEGALRRDNPALVRLAPLGQVKFFPLLAGARLQAWIRNKAATLGLEISPQAIQFLASQVGGNLWAHTQEMEKLYLYAQGRTVQENDIKLLVANAREASIFALTDAVIQRQGTLALRLLERLSEEGAEPAYLLVMITRQFRLNIQARELLDQGHRPSEIGSRLGLTSDFALNKTLEQARRSVSHPARLYRELLKADLDIKHGGGHATLEMLVVRLCQGF